MDHPFKSRTLGEPFSRRKVIQSNVKEIVSVGKPARQSDFSPVDVQRIPVPLAGGVQPGQRGAIELNDQLTFVV